MSAPKPIKNQLMQFGRNIALLFNRATMYDTSHPYVVQSIEQVHQTVEPLLAHISPLVFIFSQGQFFIDEEPLDPRINMSRIASHFKKTGIQSISFEKGVDKDDIRIFLEIASSLNSYPNANAMKDALQAKGVDFMKINHVFYKKVTEDDEVVSKEALKKVTPDMIEEDRLKSRKMFVEALLESVLTEEFFKTLNIRNLVKNPAGLTRNMIQADLKGEIGHLEGKGGNVVEGISGGHGHPGSGTAENGSARVNRQEVPRDMDQTDLKGQIGPLEQKGGNVVGGISGENSAPGSNTARIASAGGNSHGTPGSGGQGHLQGDVKSGTRSANAAPSGNTVESPGPTQAPGIGQAGSAGELKQGADSQTMADIPEGQGALLYMQLEVLEQEVEKNLSGQGSVEISELASAVFEMKHQLMAGMQAQKALGINYENEEEILEKSNEITDRVLLSLIREEYQAGRISTSRLAQILRRLVPDPAELKRLLPKIKSLLLEEGMSLPEYLKLVQDLGRELQSEGLAKIIHESSEQIGVDGEEIFEEMKKNPSQAAELIYLAAEIRKGTGDENALSELLVDYVERLGVKMGADVAEGEEGAGEKHLQKVMTDVKSNIVQKLASMDVKDDVLAQLEEKLNKRVDDMLDTLRLEWLKNQGAQSEKTPVKRLSVLQTLERSVNEKEELGEILKIVRSKVEAGEIDENDFRRIHAEILVQKEQIKDLEAGKGLPSGILKTEELVFFLEKEMARAKRYDTPFAALGFSLVKAKVRTKKGAEAVSRQSLMDAVLRKLAVIFRETDVLGQIGRKRVVALLPMTPESDGKLALRRSMRLLHLEPLDVRGTPVEIKVAGVLTRVDRESASDSKTFLQTLTAQLDDMAARIKNIHAYF